MCKFYELSENESIHINLNQIVKIEYNSVNGESEITFSSGEKRKFNKDDTKSIGEELKLTK